jgi:Cys-tRNA(Pro)/Cys-tRNA(Cys) deacylase
MTPAINMVQKQTLKIEFSVHEYKHDVNAHSYGEEAAEKLQVSPKYVFKTLVVETDRSTLAVAIIPVLEKLSLKQLAKAMSVKKAHMAKQVDVERSTGYILGGVSPLGQKKRLATFIDASANDLQTMYVSAGRRGLEIELKPSDLQKMTQAKLIDLCLTVE